MLLAVDVGNTSSVIGLFDGDTLAAEWRIATRYRTTDELDVTLRGLLASRSIDASLITAGCLSTTVPPVQQAWEEVLQRLALTRIQFAKAAFPGPAQVDAAGACRFPGGRRDWPRRTQLRGCLGRGLALAGHLDWAAQGPHFLEARSCSD